MNSTCDRLDSAIDGKEIVEKIQKLLSEQQKTQKDMFNYASISPNSLQRWKEGSSRSYTRNIYKIAEFFGVLPEYFLEGIVADSQMSNREKTLVSKFRELDYEMQEHIVRSIDYLLMINRV